MIGNEERNIAAVVMPFGIVWRNPANLVQAHLRTRETSNPYCQWAEQGRKIRARRSRWNLNHRWAA
jgi:hypothetical protein